MLEHLCDLVNLLARGQAPTEVAPWLCGASLMALPKKDGSSRPIAVGEVIRRITSKILCTAYKDHASEYLWPLQIGVAQPLGAEVGLQTAQQWMWRNRNDTSKVFLKLGFSNAFNTIDRSYFLQEVRNHMPGMAAWAGFCYARPSTLIFGNHTIMTCSQ